MAITTVAIGSEERSKILALQEGHFGDLKAIEIGPAKLTRTVAALSNAEGGEVYVGIAEESARTRHWRGFPTPEDANAHLQVFEPLFPLGEGYSYTFLESPGDSGVVLKVDVGKSRDVKVASDGKVYIRRGAQNLPVEDEPGLLRLRRNKGLVSFETETVSADPALLANSTVTLGFMLEVVPIAEPDAWLRKQQIIQMDKPTVAGIVLSLRSRRRFCRSGPASRSTDIKQQQTRARVTRLHSIQCPSKGTPTFRFMTPCGRLPRLSKASE
jgi:ATP-dependent DNA helicase RecG